MLIFPSGRSVFPDLSGRVRGRLEHRLQRFRTTLTVLDEVAIVAKPLELERESLIHLIRLYGRK